MAHGHLHAMGVVDDEWARNLRAVIETVPVCATLDDATHECCLRVDGVELRVKAGGAPLFEFGEE